MDIGTWNDDRMNAVLEAHPDMVELRESMDRLEALRDFLQTLGVLPEAVYFIEGSLKHLYSEYGMSGAQELHILAEAVEALGSNPHLLSPADNAVVVLDSSWWSLVDAVVATDPEVTELSVLIGETEETVRFFDSDDLTFVEASTRYLNDAVRRRQERTDWLRAVFGGAIQAIFDPNQ